MIKTGGPGELLAVVCSFGALCSRQVERRVQPHVCGDIIEDIIVTHAEAAANHGVILAEDRPGEPRRVSETKHGGEIVLI